MSTPDTTVPPMHHGSRDLDEITSLAFDTAPPARRLIELLKKRGWTGWTKLERVDGCHVR
jgi:hypothetical protein